MMALDSSNSQQVQGTSKSNNGAILGDFSASVKKDAPKLYISLNLNSVSTVSENTATLKKDISDYIDKVLDTAITVSK